MMAQAMDSAPLENISASTESSRRTDSPNKKRPAECSTAPSMTKAAATKALSSLYSPAKKKQSQYVRFKALLLKDAKDRGDTETIENITKVAKDSWAAVKHLTPPPPVDPATNTNSMVASTNSNLGEDIQRYLRLKGRVIKDEQDEQQKFIDDMKAYCIAFVSAATAYLQWHNIESTQEDTSSLADAVDLVTKKFESNNYWSPSVDKSPFDKSLKEAKQQLAHFKDIASESYLVAKLRNATDDELLEHVKEHHRLLRQAAELKAIERKKKVEEAAKRVAEERELENAHRIEPLITKGLYKQMKYNANLKWGYEEIRFVVDEVSPRVFAKAFGVAVGTKRATIAGHKVGRKELRFGAHLGCDDVNVTLVGEEAVAKARFTMHKY
ncbi:hypothetical protein ACHAWF_018822 [Thalassiosira exigua]